jgi:phospholipase/carboxylesterase
MLLDTVEHTTGPHPQWCVLWLHGLGADGHDFAPIVPELVRPDWPALRFVFPHAPVRAVTINAGMRMRAWYDIRDFDLTNRADLEGVDASIAQVEALIAREHERGIPPHRLLLAGFSQGGAITLATGLARAQPLAGLIALSTYLPLPPTLARQRLHPRAPAQPVFMAHGLFDPVVPPHAGEAAAQQMRDFGFSVDFHRYPMQHAVCPQEILDLRDWMHARLTA